jgi:hypothetical protein
MIDRLGNHSGHRRLKGVLRKYLEKSKAYLSG